MEQFTTQFEGTISYHRGWEAGQGDPDLQPQMGMWVGGWGNACVLPLKEVKMGRVTHLPFLSLVNLKAWCTKLHLAVLPSPPYMVQNSAPGNLIWAKKYHLKGKLPKGRRKAPCLLFSSVNWFALPAPYLSTLRGKEAWAWRLGGQADWGAMACGLG